MNIEKLDVVFLICDVGVCCSLVYYIFNMMRIIVMMMRILIIRIIIVFIERLLLFVYKKRVYLYIDICRIVLDNEILCKICDFI